MAKFYHCLRGDSSEYTITATGLTEIKMNETEGISEDASEKKKSKFKSFKKLFIKRKKKDSSTSSTKNNLKQSQSTSDVTFPESHIQEFDSETESSAPKGIMGIRAFSHDSIFIPDTSVPEPVGSKQVFSQENVSAPIRALQLKVQHNIKLGLPSSIAAKRMEDPGVSSEDDGLPRSPPESSPLHEILAHSSVAKMYAGSGCRPNSPHSPVFRSRTSSGSLSPTLMLIPISPSDTSLPSPTADFSSPAVFTTCLDTSAARHKLAVKPRNQRSTSKQRRHSKPLSGSVSELMYPLSEKEEKNEEEMREEVEEVTAAPEINVMRIAESGISSVVQIPPEVAVSSSPEATDVLDEYSSESSSLDVTEQQDTSALLNVADARTTHRSSIPTFGPETEDDVTLTEFESPEVNVAHNPQVLDIVDPMILREESSPWEADVKSTVHEVHSWSLPVDPSWASKTACLASSTLLSDASSPLCSDSEDQSGTSAVKELDDKDYVEESLPVYRVHTRMAAAPTEPFVLEACSTRQEASKHQTPSPIEPEIFSRVTLTCASEVCVRDEEMVRAVASEGIPSNEEDSEITVFKETNAKTSEDTPASQQQSLWTGSQSSFKFSITSARNRSGRRSSGKWIGDEPVGNADKLELSQKSNALPREEEEEEGKKECDLDIAVSRLSEVKAETHKPEHQLEHKPERCEKRCLEKLVEKSAPETFSSLPKLHEPSADKPFENVKAEEATEGKREEAPGLFGVKLRSTSHSLKYKESSHSEVKEVGKRQCAEVAVDSDGPVSQPKVEKEDVKKPRTVTLPSTLKDNGKTKAKSSENLAVKPPLPKKPSLQNVSPSIPAPDKLSKPVKTTTQERQKDTDKSISKSPEKGQPHVKNGQDSESPPEGSSVPAWVSMAKQKQKGFQVQHKEVKLQVQDIKATSDWQIKDKETAKPMDEFRNSLRNSPPSCILLTPDPKAEPKLSVVEPPATSVPTPALVLFSPTVDDQPPVTGNKEGRDQPSKEKLSPPASQPSWMELAKKKAKAWSDMPQIIK
ncbi:CRACD-like protein isoform X1 [Callorhinchus milii]|uniref:CRACD-like protein isoform X1 n=2 Tax=Callorhinchus milii TaxID=7868 RepID=UPI001C3F8628|nr:CRACD-like protein isoform X1 [Callorhinchus milii]